LYELKRNIVDPIDQYTTVLFGGSGKATVEAVLSFVIGEGKLLIVSNGAYGERMAEIVEVYGINYKVFSSLPILAGYDFERMHDYLYRYGITIYPGKIGQLSSFRIANIGEIDHQDITYFLEKLKGYLDTIR